MWIESRGLEGKTFEIVLKRGLVKTLLAWGIRGGFVCAGSAQVKPCWGLGGIFMEVCSPHGMDEGVVVPMGY